MASRYAITFLLACVSCFGASVQYLPVNVHNVDTKQDIDGLVFFFSEPAGDQAIITVCGQTQTIDTDRVHGDRLVFYIALPEASRHDLTGVQISIGGVSYTIDHMHSGHSYELPKRKR
jgi:hypothetical protein